MNPGNPYGEQPSSPPGYTPNFRQPRREVDLGSIGEAWNLVSANLGTYVVAGLLMLMIMGAIYTGYFILVLGPTFAAASSGTVPETNIVASAVQGIILAACITIFTSLVSSGLIITSLKALRGGKPEISDVFAGFTTNPGNVLLASVIVGFVVGIGSQLCVIPGFILGGMLMLTIPFIVDRNMSFAQAMGASWQAMSPFLVMGSVLYFLGSLVAGLGALACGLGLLVTFPMFYAMQAIVYEDLTADYQQNQEGSYVRPPGSF